MTLPSVQACQARRLLQFRKYNDRNFEIRNKNTRERMARLRSGLSPEERAARLLARRESDRQYRQKNRATIADKAKYHRQAAAAKKEELRQEQMAQRAIFLQARRRHARASRACHLAVDAIHARVADAMDRESD
ncbi:hypothetical protein FB45DRAFT_1034693 [Roridomyces roridus]|uniref:Uncharacterized protein n=1 Tax=Roridomyces roridus TaxID=1738132 RepID=A0AAD7FDK1_9AGAR|nr:hypothetical protein FB45DRAFT_1034693 [Roridomyces roridus]